MDTARLRGAGNEPHRPGSRTRRLNGLLWVAQLLLALFLVMGAIPKLTVAPEAVEAFGAIAEGRWLLTLLGLVEVAGAIGLLVPRVTVLSAIGLAVLMACATAANLSVLETPNVAVLTVGLLIAFLGIAWLRSGRRTARRRPRGTSTA